MSVFDVFGREQEEEEDEVVREEEEAKEEKEEKEDEEEVSVRRAGGDRLFQESFCWEKRAASARCATAVHSAVDTPLHP